MLAVLTATSSRQSFMKHEQVLHARKCKYFWIYPKITFAFVMDYSEQDFQMHVCNRYDSSTNDNKFEKKQTS